MAVNKNMTGNVHRAWNSCRFPW